MTAQQLGLFGPPVDIVPAAAQPLVLVREYTRKRRIAPTSRAAQEDNRPRKAGQMARVLQAIKDAENGLTNEEITKATGILLQSVCGARNQLAKDGLIENRPGEKRRTKTGSMATVWRAR